MHAYTSDQFVLPLPDRHRFPMAKYALLRARVEEELPHVELHEAPRVSLEALRRVHTTGWVERVVEGTLDKREVRQIGFPWSPFLVERSRRSVGATVAAAMSALSRRTAVNLAGGTHHAGVERGQGFCVFNDVAVAARAVQAEHQVARILVIDLDVHQGNGTAEIFSDDPSVFTLSAHGAKNFPFRKAVSDIDIPLPDGTNDAAFMEAVLPAIDRALSDAAPDLVFYVAGVDPFEGDRLGRLELTAAGLAQRDHAVLSRTAGQGIPTAVCMAGGYAPDPARIADLHFGTVRESASYSCAPLSHP
ncbi:MAG: histone deacetylase [Myxococcota bacterium]